MAWRSFPSILTFFHCICFVIFCDLVDVLMPIVFLYHICLFRITLGVDFPTGACFVSNLCHISNFYAGFAQTTLAVYIRIPIIQWVAINLLLPSVSNRPAFGYGWGISS